MYEKYICSISIIFVEQEVKLIIEFQLTTPGRLLSLSTYSWS